jgi:hypothetical protein
MKLVKVLILMMMMMMMTMMMMVLYVHVTRSVVQAIRKIVRTRLDACVRLAFNILDKPCSTHAHHLHKVTYPSGLG